MDPTRVLKYPYITEKATALIEKENKIVFIVSRDANKKQIKEAFEKLFKVKVDRVRTLITSNGKKKALIKLKKEFKASDVAAKLGIM